MGRPKSISRPPATAEIHVARRLAALRAESGLTLRALAERTGLSDAYINRVERQKTPINIANLEKVALAFGVPLASFFESGAAQEPLVLTRAGTGKKARFRGRKGYLALMLAEAKKGKLMEPILVDLASAKTAVPLKAHSGQEFNYVIEGRCVFHFGRQRIELNEGDALYFDATVPHVCRAIGKGPTRLLAVVASANYPLHGDISVLLDDA
jgi:transcriptional regulator with XRE-family HTH domain